MTIKPVLALALLAAVSITPAAPQTPSAVNPGLRVNTPQAQSTSAFTAPMACPSETGLSLTLPDKSVPAGWSPTGAPLSLLKSDVGVSSNQQELQCHYQAKFSPGSTISVFRHNVATGACIVAPDKKSFLCKPGTK